MCRQGANMKKYFITACAVTLSLIFSPILSASVLQYVQKRSQTEYVEYLTEGDSISVELNSFVCGAVAAAMPATYEAEALKAQAVCIFSYIEYLKQTNEPITREKIDYSGEEPGEKISETVKSVSDTLLYYDGAPAMALSHRLNNGKTTPLDGFPYLAEVESPGDRLCPDKPQEESFHGMSSYGADFMARQGADYREILTHYFPGTKLTENT